MVLCFAGVRTLLVLNARKSARHRPCGAYGAVRCLTTSGERPADNSVTEPLCFDNVKQAYRAKTTAEIFRGWLVFKLFAFNRLVDHNQQVFHGFIDKTAVSFHGFSKQFSIMKRRKKTQY